VRRLLALPTCNVHSSTVTLRSRVAKVHVWEQENRYAQDRLGKGREQKKIAFRRHFKVQIPRQGYFDMRV